MSKISTARNLDSLIYSNPKENKQVSSETYMPGDSIALSENVSIAISPRQVLMFDEISKVFLRVAKILTNCVMLGISVEFPTLLAISTVDGLLICEVVRGSGANSLIDTSNSKSNTLKKVRQEYYRNHKQNPIRQVIVM
ncbi:hypothetical protein [Ulvibacterium sp.]|uniref:hypothetical protein n=1 Tax=Ulvibacterium sp. TaxID=2665914 RepID=UPI003CC5CB90